MKRLLPALCLLLLLPSLHGAKPHMVIYLSDDHSQFDSSLYGAADIPTPNLEKLAKDGMMFTHAFVASPSCAPSRAAMLTGLMPARNGAEAKWERKNLANDSAHGATLPELQSTLAAWMKAQGDKETVFSEPRPLSKPGTWHPDLAQEEPPIRKRGPKADKNHK